MMFDRNEARRAWVGRAQYPGLETFHFGTVHLPAESMAHEVDQALAELWAKMSPHEPPPFVAVPGMIYFVPEGDA